jgi:hypothetical protein
MLNRVLIEATRYETTIQSDGRMAIVDRYTGIVMRADMDTKDDADALCLQMNLRSMRNAMLLPTLAMLDAGGERAGEVWLLMIRVAS